MKQIKYIPKLPAAISFMLLLVIFMLLFWGRKEAAVRPEGILNYFPDFYQHVSNLSISYLLYSGVGYFWLMLGVKRSFLILLGVVILLTNLIYEGWITVLNTPDIVDAYYGISGTIAAAVFLFLTRQFGLNVKK